MIRIRANEINITSPSFLSSLQEQLQRPPEVKPTSQVGWQRTLDGTYVPVVAVKDGNKSDTRTNKEVEALTELTPQFVPDYHLVGALQRKSRPGDGHRTNPSEVSLFYRDHLVRTPDGKTWLRQVNKSENEKSETKTRQQIANWETVLQHKAIEILMTRYVLCFLDKSYDRASLFTALNPTISNQEAWKVINNYDGYSRLPVSSERRHRPRISHLDEVQEKIIKGFPQLSDGLYDAALQWKQQTKPDLLTEAALLETILVLGAEFQSFDRGFFQIQPTQELYDFFLCLWLKVSMYVAWFFTFFTRITTVARSHLYRNSRRKVAFSCFRFANHHCLATPVD